MGVVLDIIVVGIVLLSAFMAAKKGFARTLVELVGYILAIVIAVGLSSVVADYTYDNVIKPAAVSAITDVVSEKGEDVLENIPSSIKSIAEMAGIDFKKIDKAVDESAENTAVRITETAIKPIASTLVKSLSIVIITVILFIVVGFLAKFINSFFKGVIFGTANKTLGAVLGGAKGLLYSVLLCVVISFIASVSKSDFFIFSPEAVSNSYACEFILDALNISF